MPAPPPLRVPAFTRATVREIKAVARAMPWRSELGVDAERVFWVDIAGLERIGLAWTPPTAGSSATWMIAIANSDQRPVSRKRLREVVRLIVGPDVRHELAPPFPSVPHMTLARAPDLDDR